MTATRLIKKYPNRRLYDTQQSRYITIEDVRNYVLSREPINVIDNRSKQTLTRSILLQLLAELEQREPLFSEDLLCRLIRARSSCSVSAIREHLEQGLAQLDGGDGTTTGMMQGQENVG
jgi:polyhydroxyalkanoate synthesis repressor PhaR